MKIKTLFYKTKLIFTITLSLCSYFLTLNAQTWTENGNSYYNLENNEIIKHTLPGIAPEVILGNEMLTPSQSFTPIKIEHFSFSADKKKVLIFTNTQKVWRINTRGDYWLVDMSEPFDPQRSLKKLGRSLPGSSLMFAKLSPDGSKAAYVCNNNIYVEDLETSEIKALTTDGTETVINGTFDWAYEEEFFCRDGFRWSPDGKSIAYWQIDASDIGKFYMINNTDSLRPFIIPLEYPLVGEKPSFCRVGIINIDDLKTTWLQIPGEPDQNYIIRMEFIPWSSQRLLIHQINRKQNESRIYISDALTGNSQLLSEEKNDTWIDVLDYSSRDYNEVDFTLNYYWINERKSIIWTSEAEGWRHLYEISIADGTVRNMINSDFDVIEYSGYDYENGFIYYMASPENATQKYLYRSRIDGKGNPQLMSPGFMKGTHDYSMSPGCRYAVHSFSNHFTRPIQELITVKDHKSVSSGKGAEEKLESMKVSTYVEFFTVTTADGVTMDGWMVKPRNFDPAKKYPVVFEVYTEPWEATVKDRFGIGRNFLYEGNMGADGYIYMSLDNRGTPAPKGSEWRKSIYRQIGRINIRDQAMGAAEIIKWPFVDSERIAVWGWSGGGSATLNLMFQYPKIYRTGISIAAVSNMLTYDNIYTERYMGLPQENMQDYILGSPLTHAKNLEGNLLVVHGTGDDNVHYQNAEMLINELVKHNRKFQFMPYPNRSHSMSEGEGTIKHLRNIYTDFLKENCPPGGR